MKNFRLIIILSIFTLITALAFGQFQVVDPGELPSLIGLQVRINTESGASFNGILYSVDEEFILLQDSDGQIITVLRSAAAEVLLLAPEMDEKAYFQDSAANRLLVLPTGFAMEPGEFHIANQELAVVTMSYGVSEHFTLWGGISVPGALVNGRYIKKTGENSALSVGTFAGISWFDFFGMVVPYALYSIGNPEKNFTIGSGGAFTFDSDDFSFDAAILVLGRKWILSETTAIVTENWIVWGEMSDYLIQDAETDDEELDSTEWDLVPIVAVPGIAFRIAGAKFSWDIGAILPLTIEKESGDYSVKGMGGEDVFIPIPLISLTYRID